MKKNAKLLVATLVSLTALTGCGNSTPTSSSSESSSSSEDLSVKSVTLNKKTLTLVEGKYETLKATINPANAKNKALTWSSSNEDVASVTSTGKVIGIAQGTAVITVASQENPEIKDTCSVTVTDGKIHVTSVSLNKKTLDLTVKGSEKLEVTYLPATTTEKEVIWSVSPAGVVAVDSFGNVTALAKGQATVTVTSKDNPSASDSCTVTVGDIKVQTITISGTQAINLGASTVISATVSPEDAANKNVEWSIENNGVLTTESSTTSSIVLKGAKAGSCKVKAVAKDGSQISSNELVIVVTDTKVYVDSVTLDKKTIEMTVGGNAKVTGTVSPANATVKDVTYSVDDKNVVIVDNEGNITAKAAGTATVTCKSVDDPNKSDFCVVTVENIEVSSISISGNNAINVGASTVINASILPENAANKNIEWSVENNGVLSTESTTNTTIVLKGLIAGTCKVQATAKDGSGVSSNEITITVTDPKVYVDSLTLDKQEMTLVEGENGKLVATISPSDATVKDVVFSVDDKDVLIVDNDGNITAKKAGNAIVTCKSVDEPTIYATCAVTVNEPAAVKVSSISISSSITINLGEKKVLDATVLPTNAENQSVEWTIADPTVASESTAVGKTILLEGLKVGTTTISCAALDGSEVVSNTCTITVVDPVTHVTSVSIDAHQETYTVGDEGEKLTVTVNPEGATNKNVTWKSSNPSVVYVDATGQLTILNKGTATITATSVQDTDKSDSCTITVEPKHVSSISISSSIQGDIVNIGSYIIITPTINPSDVENKGITWKLTENQDKVSVFASSDESIVLQGVKAGTVEIWAVSKDNAVESSKLTITVNDPITHVTSVSIDSHKETYTVGETGETLTATVSPEGATDKTLTWSSSDTSVVHVDQTTGKLTIMGKGSATITAKSVQDPEKTDSCVITVEPVHVSSVAIESNVSDNEIDIGESIIITATVNPSNAENKNITWHLTDSQTQVIKTSESITSLVLKGAAEGTVEVWAVAEDGSIASNKITITVNDPVIHVTSVDIGEDRSMIIGTSETITATVNPEDATYKGVTWESSNSDIVSVSSQGLLTAKAEGSATITCKSEEDPTILDSITVFVTKSTKKIVSLDIPNNIKDYLARSDEDNLQSYADMENASGTFNSKYFEEATEGDLDYQVGNQGVFNFAITSGTARDSGIPVTISGSDLHVVYSLTKDGADVNIGDYMTSAGVFQFNHMGDVGAKFVLTVKPDLKYHAVYDMEDATITFGFKVVNGYNVNTLAELSLFDNTQSCWDDYKEEHGLSGISADGGIVLHSDFIITADILPDALTWTAEDVAAYLSNPSYYEDFKVWSDSLGLSSDNDYAEGKALFVDSFRDYSTVFNRNGEANKTFDIHGNCFKIDASDLSRVAFIQNGYLDLGNMSRFVECDGSHSQIFGVNTDCRLNWFLIDNDQYFNIDNLTLIGNYSSEDKLAKGSLMGFKFETSHTSMSNCIISKTFSGFLTESYGDKTAGSLDEEGPDVTLESYQSHTSFSMDRCKIYYSYSTAGYVFGTIHNTITNSWAVKSGGPLFILDEWACGPDGTGGWSIKDEFVKYLYPASIDATNCFFYNPVTGTESWFVQHSAQSLVQNYLVAGGDIGEDGWIGQYAKYLYQTLSVQAKTITDIVDTFKVINFISLSACCSKVSSNTVNNLRGHFTLTNGGTTYSQDMANVAKNSYYTTPLVPTELCPIIAHNGSNTAGLGYISVDTSTQPPTTNEPTYKGDGAFVTGNYISYYLDPVLGLGSPFGYNIGVFLGTSPIQNLLSSGGGE